MAALAIPAICRKRRRPTAYELIGDQAEAVFEISSIGSLL
jgi:hypothetical protein